MIPIKVPNIDDLARSHADAIYDYLKERTTPKSFIKDLDEFITKIFGLQSFKDILLAKPEEIEKYAKFSISEKDSGKYKLHKITNLYTSNFSSTESKFILKGEIYNGWKFVENLGISVCPYCNLNTLFNLPNGKRTSELDHFYPKESYPLFAMSFYNLIPSCKVCNQLKNNKDFTINLFAEFDRPMAKFGLDIHSVECFWKTSGFDLTLNHSDNVAKEELNLLERHKYHKDVVLEIMQKSYIYNSTYLEELAREYPFAFGNEQEFHLLLLNNYTDENDHHKRPLSKLTRDIAEDLGLL